MTALEGTSTPLAGIRRIAARRLTEAWAAPSFPLSLDVDMQALIDGADRASGITITDHILQATARALTLHEGMNAHYVDEVITVYPTVNLGVAVATDLGLMVPVIHGVEGLSLAEIADRRRDIVTRARAGKLGMADIDGGTFSVSNLGMMGIERFSSIINPPQVAILSVGSSVRRVVEHDDGIAVRSMATFTVTCDHRAVDGAMGAQFLGSVREFLQEPATAGAHA